MKHRLLLLLLIPMVLVVANIMSFFLDDYEHDFSLTQKYRPIHAVYNWNMPFHAFDDFDGDGKLDQMSFFGCAYLSGNHSKRIVPKNRCEDPIMSLTNDQIPNNTVGQALGSGDPSFLIQEKNGRWRYYTYGLTELKIYEIGPSGFFERAKASFLDRVDYLLYMPTHILLILFF